MTQAQLIEIFPKKYSIADRVLLVPPAMFNRLKGLSIKECRIFLLVTEGTVTITSGYSQTCLKTNTLTDMLVWDPITFSEMSEDAHAWCIFPNHIFTNESLNEMKPADSESFKDRHSVPVLNLDYAEANVLDKQLNLLLEALGNKEHYYRTELCQTYFRSFMLESGNIRKQRRNINVETESVETRQDTILRSFLKLVWKYYKTEHNLDFYAEKLCLSSKHLSRVVKERLGKTPYSVIRDELLQRAEYLLKDTKLPIQDISADLHFSEMAAFCKFFKKHTGVSPTAFRAASRKGIKQEWEE
jgi:AraC-like DNA-binding protein